MEYNILINSLGLVLDIIGAILLFKYGLPENINRGGYIRLCVGIDEQEKIKAKKYDFMGKIGLGLLIMGFLLQLISNFIYK